MITQMAVGVEENGGRTHEVIVTHTNYSNTYEHSLSGSEEQSQALSFNLGNAWAKEEKIAKTKLV